MRGNPNFIYEHRARERLLSLHPEAQWHDIFDFWFFFHESVSPKPLRIPLGPFRIFLKISGDILVTGGKWKNSSIIKVLIILFGHLQIHFWQIAAGIIDTDGKSCRQCR
jgi:hypothetical protein